MKETQVTIENLDFVLNFPGGLQAELTYEDQKEYYAMSELLGANPEPLDTTVCRGNLHLLGSALTLLTQAFELLKEDEIKEQTIDLNNKEWWTKELEAVPFRDLCGEDVIGLEITAYDQWWLYHFELCYDDHDPELISIGVNAQTGEYLPNFLNKVREYPLVEGGPQIERPILSNLGLRESYYLACHAVESLLASRSMPLVASIIHSVDCVSGSNPEQSSAQRDFSPFFSIKYVAMSSQYFPVLTYPDKLQLHWPGPRVVRL